MTSHLSSRRLRWWRSASTKTSWPISAATTGVVCFSLRPLQMGGIPRIIGALKYVEFDFSFTHTAAAGFLSHSSQHLVRLLAQQLVNDCGNKCISLVFSHDYYYLILNVSVLQNCSQSQRISSAHVQQVVCLSPGTLSCGSAWSTAVEGHFRIFTMVKYKSIQHPILVSVLSPSQPVSSCQEAKWKLCCWYRNNDTIIMLTQTFTPTANLIFTPHKNHIQFSLIQL